MIFTRILCFGRKVDGLIDGGESKGAKEEGGRASIQGLGGVKGCFWEQSTLWERRIKSSRINDS